MYPRNGVLWMWLALSACNAGERDLPEPYRSLAVPQERLASAEARDRGRELYLRHCVLCHGASADGRGVRREGLGAEPADFTSHEWRRRMTPRRVLHAIREGRRGTPMAAWPGFSDDEAWDLVAYLLSVAEPRP